LKDRLKLLSILVVGVISMASASIVIRFAQGQGAPSLVIAAYRLGTASLVLSIPALFQQAWQDYVTLSRHEFGMLVLSSILLGLHFSAWITSLAYSSVATSVVLVTTTPLWIGLAAPVLLDERISPLAWIGMLGAIAGGSLMAVSDLSQGQGNSAALGGLLSLLAAIAMAGYLIIGRGVRSRIRLISYLWFVYSGAAAFLLALAVGSRYPLTGYPLSTTGLMVFLGLVPQLVGHTAANYAVRQLPAAIVSIATLGEPVSATILAAIFLKEQPQHLQLVGGVIVLCGILIATLPTKQTAHVPRRRPKANSRRA
jgi:drug/metabolite transporter (DMT)-like permease